jgi:hypothetical protein
MILVVGLFTASAAAQASARRSLNTILPELKFDNITLADAMDFLRDTSGANIHVNWRALEEIGIGKDTTINVRLRNVTLRRILRTILTEASSGSLLTYYIDENIIEVTKRELADQQMITRIYPVDDLIMDVPDFEAPQFQIQATQTGRGGGGGGGQNLFGDLNSQTDQRENMTRTDRAQQLIDMIQEIIQPDVWNINGGRAAIRFWNGSLIVTAPRSVHEALGGYSE